MILAWPAKAQHIGMNQSFDHDTIISPFTGSVPVWSLKMKGGVKLFSDSSLVRVVMQDDAGTDHLVYEANPLITTTQFLSVPEGCDETRYLEGVTASRLRIDIINAQVIIDSLFADTNYIASIRELRAASKRAADSVKVVIMNQRIAEEKMYWRAEITSLVELSFREKEIRFGQKYNLCGFEYYRGGLFEFIHHRSYQPSNGAIVEEFDWRNRHGSNIPGSAYYNASNYGWIQQPELQQNNTCFIYAASHAVADFINIYSNTFYNYHVSEQELLSCPSPACGSCNFGGSYSCILDYTISQWVYTDQGCPPASCIQPVSCDSVCHQPERIGINSYTGVFPSEDNIKSAIATGGPLVTGLNSTLFAPIGHAMEFIGYKVVKPGDTVYTPSTGVHNYIIINDSSSLVNHTAWIFKNSLTNPGEPWFFQFCGDPGYFLPIEQLHGHIFSSMSTNPFNRIHPECKDEDSDGYYWWGVGSLTPDCGCPPFVTDAEKDCDDHDPNFGPYALVVPNPDSLPKYACKPNPCQTRNIPLEIDTVTVWNTIRHIDCDVVITTGNKLTIHGIVFFSPGARILVQPGAELEVSGMGANSPAILTSGCGFLWGGIEVWGDPVQPQTPMFQGKVTLSQAIIEKSVTGVKTLISGYYPDKEGGPVSIGLPTGGIVQATYTTFRNNKTGIEFFPYRDGNNGNLSYFRACRFETTEKLLNDLNPMYGIKASGINLLKIAGCSFANTLHDTIGFLNRGTGIYSYNSQLQIDSIRLNNTNHFPSFSKLNYGFYGLRSPLGPTMTNISNTTCAGNRGGIYLSGYQELSPIKIQNNSISLAPNAGEGDQYGIYLENCSGFKVMQNLITGNQPAGGNQFGIIVNNSGPDNNYIYDNSFESLKVGIQGLNINRNSDALIEGGVPVFIPTGLRFICNKFNGTGCASDFLINDNMQNPPTRPGIAYNQRNTENALNPSQVPAGNVFTFSHTLANTNDYDINISSSVGDILYTHHTLPQDLDLKPDDVTNPGKVDYEVFSLVPFVDSTSCHDTFYPVMDASELSSALSEAKYKVDSLINILKLLVDDGSTDILNSNVENSTSNQSYEIFEELMSGSPFLSDTIVKTSIEKEEVLPNAMIRDIMVANPQSVKNEELLDAIDRRNEPMPDSMWVEILQRTDTVGAMEQMISELDGWIQRRDLYFNAMAELFLKDTDNEWAPDSLITLLESDHQPSSHYLLVQYYLNHFNFTEAGGELQSITSQFDLNDRQYASHQNFISLVSVLPALLHDSTGFLVPDSTHQQLLANIAETSHDLAGAWARNILIESGLLNYHEPIVIESTLKSSRKGKYHWTQSRTIDSEIKVFPNPANDYIIVEYENHSITDEIHLILYDSRGIKTGIFSLTKAKDQKVISTRNFPSGNYFIQLCVDRIPKATCKVIIIR